MSIFIDLDARPALVRTDRAATEPLIQSSERSVADLVSVLQRAYAERVLEYQRDLTELTGANATYGFGEVQSRYPEITVVLDGQPTALPLDADLYTSLFDLYVFYGWHGVMAAEQALHERLQGERDLTLLAARRFFTFTRNTLALAIRETLIGIEALAAASVFDRLGQVSRLLSGALFGDLKFEVIPEHEEVVLYSDMPVKVPVSYRLRDRTLADALFKTLGEAVDARETYNRLVEAQQELRKRIQQADVDAANESAPGWRSPSPGEGAAERRRRLLQEDAATEAEVARALTVLQQTQRQVYLNAPLALLVLPGLPPKFSQDLMEDTLGTALVKLGNEVDRVAERTRPGQSRIQADLRGLPTQGTQAAVKPGDIEDLYRGPIRVELDLLGIAAAYVDDDPGYVALLHAGTWQHLIRSGVIARDSFEYVVASHWIDAIAEHEEEAARNKESLRRTLSVASAGLSLLALVIPPLAPLALAADLALLAFSVHAAASQLTAIDNKVRTELPALASAGYEALAEIGALEAALVTAKQSLAREIVVQLAMLPLQQIKVIGRVLQARAYFNDAVTLITYADGQDQT